MLGYKIKIKYIIKMKKNKDEKQANLPPMLNKLHKQVDFEFDYEINSIKLDENDELNSKMYYYDKQTKSYSNS